MRVWIPEIDKKVELFGASRADEIAHTASAPLLGQLPVYPDLAKFCDEGNIERYDSEVVSQIGESILNIMSTGEAA